MKKRTFFYIPHLLLFLFAGAALFSPFSHIPEINTRVNREAGLPFSYMNGGVISATPAAQASGINVGDHIDEINGRDVNESDAVFNEELDKLKVGEPIRFRMSRPPGPNRGDLRSDCAPRFCTAGH